MKARWMIALVAGGLVAPAFAQREPGGARQEGPSAQVTRRPQTPLELSARLAETLSLSAEQKTKYNAIVDKFRPKWEAQAGDREKMQDLMRQMREARQNNDEARAEQLRAQVDQLRESSRNALAQFFKEVEPILTPEQVVKLNEFRDQTERARGGPGAGLDQMIQRLPEELKLTDEQKPKFDELVTKFHAQQQEVLPLMQELQKARQDGNEKRVAELEKQIQEKSGDSGVDGFLAKLEPILTDAQKAKLPDVWLRYGGGNNPEDARSMLRAARRLTLTEEQQTRLNDILRNVMHASRGATTAEKRAELGKTTKSQVLALLDAKQKEEFEKSLERPARPMRGGRGGPQEGGGGENP